MLARCVIPSSVAVHAPERVKFGRVDAEPASVVRGRWASVSGREKALSDRFTPFARWPAMR
jgi:hypothetical protein